MHYIIIKAVGCRGKAKSTKRNPCHKITATSPNIIMKAEHMEIENSPEGLKDLVFSGTDNGLVCVMKIVLMNFNGFKCHLNLHNRYSPLMNEHNDAQEDHDDEFIPISNSYSIFSEDVQVDGQYFRAKKALEHEKKTERGKRIKKIEENHSKSTNLQTKNCTEAEENFKLHLNNRKELRDYYYSEKMVKIKEEIRRADQRYRDRMCSEVRKYCKEKDQRLVMCISDRGYGHGSRIKGYLNYGGQWKQNIHSRNTVVAVTNENNISQLCMYFFSKITHPEMLINKNGKQKIRDVKGVFLYMNPLCMSMENKRATQTRDKVYAAATVLSGISMLLFQQTFPAFLTKCFSKFKTEFSNKTKFLWTPSDFAAG